MSSYYGILSIYAQQGHKCKKWSFQLPRLISWHTNTWLWSITLPCSLLVNMVKNPNSSEKKLNWTQTVVFSKSNKKIDFINSRTNTKLTFEKHTLHTLKPTQHCDIHEAVPGQLLANTSLSITIGLSSSLLHLLTLWS
jgi:hypothetical protein